MSYTFPRRDLLALVVACTGIAACNGGLSLQQRVTDGYGVLKDAVISLSRQVGQDLHGSVHELSDKVQHGGVLDHKYHNHRLRFRELADILEQTSDPKDVRTIEQKWVDLIIDFSDLAIFGHEVMDFDDIVNASFDPLQRRYGFQSLAAYKEKARVLEIRKTQINPHVSLGTAQNVDGTSEQGLLIYAFYSPKRRIVPILVNSQELYLPFQSKLDYDTLSTLGGTTLDGEKIDSLLQLLPDSRTTDILHSSTQALEYISLLTELDGDSSHQQTLLARKNRTFSSKGTLPQRLATLCSYWNILLGFQPRTYNAAMERIGTSLTYHFAVSRPGEKHLWEDASFRHTVAKEVLYTAA